MQTPLVSISLVAYNAESFIRDAIEGCLKQKGDIPYEIIIHDDASQDQTPQIIKEYSQKYPNIIVPILQTENQFSQGEEIISKNIVPKARGKFIAFVEADDYWIDKHKLQLQTEFMVSHPETSMCFTATKHVYLSGSRKPKLKRYKKFDCVCAPKDVIHRGGRLVDMVSVLVKRSIFDDLPDWYFHKQIWDVTIPLLSLLHGNIYYIDKVTSVYRYSVPGSWTQDNVKRYEKRKLNLEKTIKFLDGFNQASDHEFDQYVTKKINSLIVPILLLQKPNDLSNEPLRNYYNRIPLCKKIEFLLFRRLGSFRLWERYRQFINLFSVSKFTSH